MNLTPLQNLLPEWEFWEMDGGFAFNPTTGGPRHTKNQADRDILCGEIERALLKRGWQIRDTAAPAGWGGVDGERFYSDALHRTNPWRGSGLGETKLAARLDLIERLPGLGGEEKE